MLANDIGVFLYTFLYILYISYFIILFQFFFDITLEKRNKRAS